MSSKLRLKLRLAGLREETLREEASREPTNGGEPLPRLMALAAETLGAGPPPDGQPGEAALDTPAAAADLGKRYRLGASLERRKVGDLNEGQFPCLALLKDGGARLLTGSAGGEGYAALGSAGPYVIAAPDLAAQETGSLIVLSRLEAPVENATAGPARDPIRQVLAEVLSRHRALLLQMLLAAGVSKLMLVALPVYTGLVYDRVIPHNAIDTLWALSLGISIALIGDFAMRAVRMKLQDAIAARASAELQADAVRRLLGVKLAEAPSAPAGFLMRLREIDNLANLAPAIVAGALVDLPFLVFVFALIWANGGLIVLAPVFGVVVLAVAHEVALHLGRSQQLRAAQLAQAQSNRLTEALESLESVKLARGELTTLRKFEWLYDEYAYSAHVSRLWSGLAAYVNVTIGQLMIVMVMLIGVYQVSAGAMTLGALSSCSLLVGRVITPIGQVIVLLHKMRQTRELHKSLQPAPMPQEEAGDSSASPPKPGAGAIAVRNLSFAYAAGERQLQEISFDVKPGERVALIGRSGSGKSTLLRLIVRLLEPTQGAIQIDGLDARQYAPGDLRAAIGLMSQSGGLFDGDLLYNLAFGTEGLKRETVAEAARIAGVLDFAARHPKGLSLAVGPRGSKLSGGERQSALLARALLADPKTLLLDEPTASMDTALEMRIVRELKQHLGARTLIVATHRAPVLELVDRVIWLDGGRIIADGPKAEVLRRMSGAA